MLCCFLQLTICSLIKQTSSISWSLSILLALSLSPPGTGRHWQPRGAIGGCRSDGRRWRGRWPRCRHGGKPNEQGVRKVPRRAGSRSRNVTDDQQQQYHQPGNHSQRSQEKVRRNGRSASAVKSRCAGWSWSGISGTHCLFAGEPPRQVVSFDGFIL